MVFLMFQLTAGGTYKPRPDNLKPSKFHQINQWCLIHDDLIIYGSVFQNLVFSYTKIFMNHLKPEERPLCLRGWTISIALAEKKIREGCSGLHVSLATGRSAVQIPLKKKFFPRIFHLSVSFCGHSSLCFIFQDHEDLIRSSMRKMKKCQMQPNPTVASRIKEAS